MTPPIPPPQVMHSTTKPASVFFYLAALCFGLSALLLIYAALSMQGTDIFGGLIQAESFLKLTFISVVSGFIGMFFIALGLAMND